MSYLIVDNLTLKEKRISEIDYRLIRKNTEFLSKISYEIDYYRLLRLNIKHFIDLQDKIQIRSEDNIMLLNSGFANWLNAFYMWSEHHKYNFDLIFQSLKSVYEEDFKVFKLAQILRNYETHKSFTIEVIEFDSLKEKSSYIIRLDQIAESLSDSRNSNYQKWLRRNISTGELTSKLDAIEYTKEFDSVIVDMQHEIWNMLAKEIKDTYETCINILNFDYSTLYNLAIIDDNEQRGRFSVGHILSQAVRKIGANYPNKII